MVALLFLSLIHLFMIPKDVMDRDTKPRSQTEGNPDMSLEQNSADINASFPGSDPHPTIEPPAPAPDHPANPPAPGPLPGDVPAPAPQPEIQVPNSPQPEIERPTVDPQPM
jgi:hypothetical protein